VKLRTPHRAHCKAVVAAVVVSAILLLLPTSIAHAQQVVAFVNGQPITNLDIEHRSKFTQMSTKKVPSRREVLDGLIDEILEVTEAKRFGLDISDADVDAQYSAVATRMGMDADKLTQLLVAGGASADTLKRRLRAQVAWTNLVRGRYRASLEIRDKDVEAQAQQQQQKPEETGGVGYEYIMRPVVFIVPRGSADSAYEARKHEAEALRGRFANCTDGVAFARALPDVAVRDQVSKYSADLAQELRQILDGTAVGHLTPPEQTAEGVQMFAVCAKKETKSETPLMREVRDQMFQQKFGAQAKRYLDNLRRQAMIEYKMPEGK
jgi:peptidyl-prolyl cis-trans isomerase SurA